MLFGDSAACGFLYSMIPFIVRAASGLPIFGGETWGDVPAIIISLCNVFVTFFIFASNFAFLIVGILDFRRRRFVAESLDLILTRNLVRTRSYVAETLKLGKDKLGESGRLNAALDSIKIDLTHPKNVIGWYVLRLVLSDFGFVFYRRLNVYAAYFGTYVTLQVVFIILQVFIPEIAVNDVPLVLILFDLVVFMVLLVLIVSQSQLVFHLRLHLHLHHPASPKKRQRLEELPTKSVAIMPNTSSKRSWIPSAT